MNDQNHNARKFSDTLFGRVLTGLLIAFGSALITWFVTRLTYVPPPPPTPKAEIRPGATVAQANQIVEFTAQGSSTPSPEAPTFSWTVGGLPPNKSPIARCTDRGSILGCRFILPGTFAVSVEVLDANGQNDNAAASVTVSIPNGYLGLVVQSGSRDALRALLYDVDWVSLQTLVSQPIVLQDPDTDTPIYAALADSEAGDQSGRPWRGAASGLKVALPGLPFEARAAFENALAEIGVRPVTMPFGEIITAAQRGAVDLGFVPIESPGALASLTSKNAK